MKNNKEKEEMENKFTFTRIPKKASVLLIIYIYIYIVLNNDRFQAFFPNERTLHRVPEKECFSLKKALGRKVRASTLLLLAFVALCLVF